MVHRSLKAADTAYSSGATKRTAPSSGEHGELHLNRTKGENP